jgi:hypothetical protein
MRFHVLKGVVGSEAETWYEPIGEPRLGEAPRCPVCGNWIGGKEPLPPYVAKLRAFGHIVGDVAFDMASDDLLVSERFLCVWHDAGLHGLEGAGDVELRGLGASARASQVGRYYHVRPGRTGARIDVAESCLMHAGPVTCPLCGGAGIDAILALRIDEASWGDEDIFIPWGLYACTVVTDRVVSLAAEHGLQNVTTIPIEAYRWGTVT